MKPIFPTIGVVGTGAMGRGIAQIAAQAGSTVKLYDTQPQAISQAIDNLNSQWHKLCEKGKLTVPGALSRRAEAEVTLKLLFTLWSGNFTKSAALSDSRLPR